MKDDYKPNFEVKRNHPYTGKSKPANAIEIELPTTYFVIQEDGCKTNKLLISESQAEMLSLRLEEAVIESKNPDIYEEEVETE